MQKNQEVIPTIVSLLPSATEIVCAMGLRNQLLGISHECNYPEDIEGLPVVSSSKIDSSADSATIDHSVRTLAHEGLSLYEIDGKLLEQLKPGLVITQDQCHVCAVSLSEVQSAVSKLTTRSTKVCSLHPEKLTDIYGDIQKIGQDTNSPVRAEKIIQSMKARIEPLTQLFSGQQTPKVLCLEWLDPPMVAGGWIPELVKIAGGSPVIVSEPGKFAEVGWDVISRSDPDFVILMPCGFSVARTKQELENMQVKAAISQLRATLRGRCYIVDGDGHFNRPGPRIADSCEILAAVLHPERCLEFRNRHREFIAQWPRG